MWLLDLNDTETNETHPVEIKDNTDMIVVKLQPKHVGK